MTTQPATAEVTKLESMERARRRNLIIQYIFMVLLAAFFLFPLVFVFVSTDPPLILFVAALAYAVSGPLMTLVLMRRRRAARSWFTSRAR